MRETIDRCALFVGTRTTDRDAVEEIAREHTYASGTLIVCAGDPGHALYLIRRGSVEVVVRAEDGSEVVVAELHGAGSGVVDSGGFFGEMSLLDVEPRSASVRAKGEVSVVAIAARKLLGLFQSNPELHLAVMSNMARILARRLREANERWGT